MPAFSQSDFLTLWEDGRRLHPLDRGLLAIQMLRPAPAGEDVADWSLGRRNQALAALHARCFGPQIEGWTVCEGCGEKLEFRVDCRALMDRQREGGTHSVLFKGRAFRPPTSRDLARIAREGEAETAALRLAELCRMEGGEAETQDPAAWTGADFAELSEAISLADPLAEILLSLDCPACGYTREETLDLPAFFWAELDAAAKQLLREIHTLATAYGWNEAEILSLSDARRAMYLHMVQA